MGSGEKSISSSKYLGGGDSLWKACLLSTKEYAPTDYSNDNMKLLLFSSESSGFSSSAKFTASVYELFKS